MDIKKKQDILIFIIIFTGVIFPFFFPDTGIKAIEYLRTGLLFPNSVCAFGLFYLFELNMVLIVILAALFQYLTYAFLAWIIIKLVYPNKKLPSEPDTPSGPPQD